MYQIKGINLKLCRCILTDSDSGYSYKTFGWRGLVKLNV